jgi:hypothetical protein
MGSMRTEFLVGTGVFEFALVFSELDPETLLRVGNPLHRTQGHFELPIAKSTDSDGGGGAHPFDHPKTAFRNGSLLVWRLGRSLRGSVFPLGACFLLNALHYLLSLAVFVGLRPFLFLHMLCGLSRAGVRFGFALRLHDTHLSGRILVLASMGTHPYALVGCNPGRQTYTYELTNP